MTRSPTPTLDALLRLHGSRVVGWVLRLGEPGWEPVQMADEILADALTDIGADRLADPAPLFTLTRRHVQRRRRKERLLKWLGRPPQPERPRLSSPATEAQRRHRAEVQQVLGHLPPEEREVFVLVDIDGLLPVEAAGWLNRSEAQVLRLLLRGRSAVMPAVQAVGLKRDTLAAAVLGTGRG